MDLKEIKLLSDEDLASHLRQLGADIGPIVASTRGVYERKLHNLTHGNTSASPRTQQAPSPRSHTYEEPEQEEQYDDEPEEHEPVKRSMYTSSFTDTSSRNVPAADYYRKTDFDSGSSYRTASYTRTTYEPLSNATRRFPSSTYQYQPTRQSGVSGQPAKKQGGWMTLILQLVAIILLMVVIYYFFSKLFINKTSPKCWSQRGTVIQDISA